jgi:hypothetical protein
LCADGVGLCAKYPAGHGEDDLLNLIVEIKGYRSEDAKENKSTMEPYRVPGVNHLGTHGCWAFAELTEIYRIESDFEAKVQQACERLVEDEQKGALAEVSEHRRWMNGSHRLDCLRAPVHRMLYVQCRSRTGELSSVRH